MTPHPRILDVVANDLCIACGACLHACPFEAIRPVFHTARGAYEVAIDTSIGCAGCPAPCDRVCPSLEVDLVALASGGSSREPVSRSGPIEGMWTGYAGSHQHNGRSSSGGLVRAFIEAALEAKTPVLCLAREGDDYGAAGLHDLTELERVPGSIYHSVSFTAAIGILRGFERPGLVVAIPCHLEGLLKYTREIDPSLSDRIQLVVGLICGWSYTHHSLAAFASYKGIPGPVRQATYRGEGKRGQLRFVATDGEHVYERERFASFDDRIDYLAAFSRAANRLRCRTCQDHVNVLCDVAVGDAWLARFPTEKLSLVVARTPRGLVALRDLEERGRVILADAQSTDLVESQSVEFVESPEARALTRFLTDRGASAPHFDYGDGAGPAPRATQRAAFAYELAMRRALRAGRYRALRRLYRLRKAWRELGRRARRLRAGWTGGGRR